MPLACSASATLAPPIPTVRLLPSTVATVRSSAKSRSAMGGKLCCAAARAQSRVARMVAAERMVERYGLDVI
jgi:hypothetical protein